MNPHMKLVGFGTSNKVKNHWFRIRRTAALWLTRLANNKNNELIV